MSYFGYFYISIVILLNVHAVIISDLTPFGMKSDAIISPIMWVDDTFTEKEDGTFNIR